MIGLKMVEKNKILFISPHTDDIELSCGGTLSRFLEEGKEICVVAFSTAKANQQEFDNSMELLGVKNYQLYNYQFRIFKEQRQAILDDLIRIRDEFQPDIVFLPAENDTHQDHEVIFQEGFRAFKKSSILGYQQTWNQRKVHLEFFIPLEERHINKKIKATNCYSSQQQRFYSSPEYLKSEAKYWGSQIGVSYAEIFQVIRWIL